MSSAGNPQDRSRAAKAAATFEGGRNIAMKVPPHQYDATVRFYRDVLGLKPADGVAEETAAFEFGANTLWIDEVPTMSQAELWLELVTDDTAAAGRLLAEAGVSRCDAIEALANDFDGFWISSPASIVHLVDAEGSSPQ